LRIVSVARLVPGMRLAKPVFSQSGGHRYPLLAEGVVIGESMPAALERAGVGAVYIEDAASEGITPQAVLPPEVREEVLHEVSVVFDVATRHGPGARISSEELVRLQAMVPKVIAAIRSSGGLASSLAGLNGFDHYTLEHSVNVMTLGLAVGDAVLRRMGWNDWKGRERHDSIDQRLTYLGMGLLLHDIGKMIVPVEILHKPGPLTDEEMAIVREHPVAGVQMIDGEVLPASSKVVILGHHERYDGSGYPYGQKGDEIHIHAQVAGIVDVYDAVSSTRVYSARRPAHVVWEMIVGMANQAFARELVRVFAETVVPYSEGVTVLLSDGRRAIVAKNTPGAGSRPLVRVITDEAGAPVRPFEVDLARTPDLSIRDSLLDMEYAAAEAERELLGAATGSG
jgi:HD-GYP domain-containing protein (c-di-GMP phosphodiesterase class II)